VITLYDADRCPYCARARIVLHEKALEWETVVIDLSDRPAWLYEKNPLGKVPVLEEDALVLPESVVIMAYLDERYPEPPLLPADAAERALAHLWIERFEKRFADPYYALRRGDESARPELAERLHELDKTFEQQPYLTPRGFGLADIAYVPWILRLGPVVGVEIDEYEALSAWLERLCERSSIAAEVDIVAALPR
jgi:glutathione S-transferase